MRQRVITGVIFAIAVAAFMIPSIWFPAVTVLFAVIVGAVATFELIKALKHGGFRPATGLIVFGCILSFIILIVSGITGGGLMRSVGIYSVLILIYAMLTAVIPSVLSTNEKAFADGIYSLSTILYVTFPLFSMCAVTLFAENGWYYMIAVLVAPWVSDVFAYFTGVLFGKHKIIPHISPKKTWEGCIGGAVFCAISFALYFDLVLYNLDGIKMNRVLFAIIMFVIGFVVSVMSQLGDWLASLIKRRVGIKDYGNFMPGHGGMLDRFDSAFFTLPLGVVVALIADFLGSAA